MTPLIQAIKSKNTALALLLIDRGANPLDVWYDGWSALHESANTKDLVRCFLLSKYTDYEFMHFFLYIGNITEHG